ncbi:protein rep [Achromobacter aegrifaciens]|uniref:protein rep n=1 Tax=Achromobacter aegrifaciens TaxID=1287736 RepID=UPI00286883B3|nr:protein rep [Achromobacter aegrifaciens]
MAYEKKNPPETACLATEVSEGFDEIEKFPSRLLRLSKARKASDETIRYGESFLKGERQTDEFLLTDLGPVVRRMDGCAQWLRFRQYFTINKIRLGGIHTCQIPLLCQFCAILRAARQLKAYFARYNVVVAENSHLKPYLLTLTVANGDDLKERLSHLQSCFKEYCKRRRQWKSVGRGFNEFCKIEGAAFSYEVTRNNENKSWHPHLHAVILVDPNNPIDFPVNGSPSAKKNSKLSQEWLAITGDSSIVDCRPISENPMDGFLEVFKYTVKFSEMHDFDKYMAYFTLKGKRLQGSFGLFWGVKVPENETDDIAPDLPYVELIYRHTKNGYEIFHVGERAIQGGIELPGNTRSFVPMPTDGYVTEDGEYKPFTKCDRKT